MGYDFKVTVVEATGLPNKDGLFNKSDPYVELYGCARASAASPLGSWARSSTPLTATREWTRRLRRRARACCCAT